MALLDEIPNGESWRVAVDGTYRHYKTKAGAEKRMAELQAQGKQPTLSTYVRRDTLIGGLL